MEKRIAFAFNEMGVLMRVHALQPTVRIIASTGPLAHVVIPAGGAMAADSLALAGRTSAVPAVAMSLTATGCDCSIDEHLQLADEADKAGSAYFSIAKEHYTRATAMATTATDLYAIGDHAANRGYSDHAKAAREKAVLAAMAEARSLEARLATAAKADSFGSLFFDDAKRCYDEAIAKAGNRQELIQIAQHAQAHGYTDHAKLARTKALSC
jgi:hypothetical protein